MHRLENTGSGTIIQVQEFPLDDELPADLTLQQIVNQELKLLHVQGK